MSYFYEVVGLRVVSDFPIPEWKPIHPLNQVDLRIQTGNIASTDIQHPIVDREYFQMSPQEYQIAIGGIAQFVVKSGNRIMVHPYQGAHQTLVRRFLQSRIMSVLLFQRNILPLSACTLYGNNTCVLLTGHSAYPTKILPSWYQQAGYTVLNAYLTPIFNDGKTAAGYHHIGEKPISSEQIYHSVDTVIELAPQNISSFETHSITGVEKFNLLKRNLQYKKVLLQLNLKDVFYNFGNMLQQAACYRVTIPQQHFSFKQLIKHINEII